MLATAATLESVPPMFRAGTRFHDLITTAGGEEHEIHELIWEVSELTQAADTELLERRNDIAGVDARYDNGVAVSWQAEGALVARADARVLMRKRR